MGIIFRFYTGLLVVTLYCMMKIKMIHNTYEQKHEKEGCFGGSKEVYVTNAL
jgi:hypothetical protein